MAKKPKSSQPSQGEGPSRHQGSQQHGWSPDVDETRQQDNPSAHRSFHPEEHAPEKGKGRKVSREEAKSVPGDTAKSTGRRGEEQAKRADEEGMHDTGSRGRSQRSSGTKDASAFTGVDPQDPPGKRRNG
ncbi:hypothetical protein OG883_38085 [Streptomyces sp. NBC_01142]|uniref:hypothetical protein n=1 Tax=Streptomyces sp. NBC_01142 TaxID=2975865 RepID=UPI0022563810|nr:hypothetical protein [Streptomyces sp. NBC_01142]MCX4825564.1 hypothetical protein [Streptomyces sp. NBC_01142]